MAKKQKVIKSSSQSAYSGWIAEPADSRPLSPSRPASPLPPDDHEIVWSLRRTPEPELAYPPPESPSIPPILPAGPPLDGGEDEEDLVIGKDVSPTFSMFSLPSPPQHPRAWSPPPVQRTEEQSEPPVGQSNNVGRLRNYSKRRRELLDILNDLHSTG
jgi:hypothetical protein